MNILQQPFFQITVPLLFGLYLASWYSGKRFDDLKGLVKDVKMGLTAVEARLTSLEKKVEALELQRWR